MFLKVHTGECMGFYVVSMGIFHVQDGSFMPAKIRVSTLILLGIKWDTVMGYNRPTT